LTWLLFEEPEAFLHPSQIDALDINLRAISQTEGNQVLITTHNPEFVSKNIEDLPSLIRLCKEGTQTKAGQISPARLKDVFLNNQKDLPLWLANKKITITAEDLTEDMESVKYALWLDPRRSSAFFAHKVLLVEGPTETALIGYLLGMGQISTSAGGIFILDTIGKFNIHRFMNLMGELHIPHAVLVDNDNNKYPEVDSTINSSCNHYTLGIEQFPEDIEEYLGIPKGGSHRKPQHLMWHIQQGNVNKTKIEELTMKVREILCI
jgi:predicted ATP-dependent endonuclease of OLD family